ncbi:MAG TPA: diguanylate cyclase [Spirochaetia bacterium]|nr:diguanylate cyclase [Spirochaetia bacterium]HRZ64304.1 diguanylate cyclase [Spirochaetia bacterium]
MRPGPAPRAPRLHAPSRLAALLLLLAAAPAARALEPIVVDGAGGYRTEGRLELLRDPGASLSPAQAEARAADFAPAGGRVPNLGLTGDAVWLRFELANGGSEARRAYVEFGYPVADSVSLIAFREGGRVDSFVSGDSVPESPPLPLARGFAFPLELGPSERVACLLRVRSSAGMSLPVRVLEEGELARETLRDSLCHGLLFGSLAWFLLYLLASPRREAWLRWYCAYALALALHVAIRAGYLRLLLGPAALPLANLANLAAIGALFFTGTAFFRSFLGLRSQSRALDGAMLALELLALALPFLALLSVPAALAASVLVNLVGPLSSIAIALALWAKGAPNAGLFAAAWLLPHLVAVADFLRIHGLLPYPRAERLMLPASLALALAGLGWAVVRRRSREAALARVDALTGLANRRCLDEELEREWSRSRRSGSPLALLMVDIDDFKRYNDERGHRAGDQCLRAVAAVLASSARRAGDLAARYGGEEFTLLLPNTGLDEALHAAERLRAGVEAAPSPEDQGRKGARLGVTVSVGAAARVPAEGEEVGDLVAEADRALYRAKAAGKNAVRGA